jgi:stress-induced morphogen
MSNMNRTEKLRHKIESTFAPVSCQIEDESALHAGHAGRPAVAGITKSTSFLRNLRD